MNIYNVYYNYKLCFSGFAEIMIFISDIYEINEINEIRNVMCFVVSNRLHMKYIKK